jgi:hypothetical protein
MSSSVKVPRPALSREALQRIRDRKPLPIPGISGLVPEYHALHDMFELLDMSVCLSTHIDHRRWQTLQRQVQMASQKLVAAATKKTIFWSLTNEWNTCCRECTLEHLGKMLFVWRIELTDRDALYLLEWLTLKETHQRDFTLNLTGLYSRTDRVLARDKRTSEFKAALLQHQQVRQLYSLFFVLC